MKIGDLVVIYRIREGFENTLNSEYLGKITEIIDSYDDDIFRLSIDNGKFLWFSDEIREATVEDLFE